MARKNRTESEKVLNMAWSLWGRTFGRCGDYTTRGPLIAACGVYACGTESRQGGVESFRMINNWCGFFVSEPRGGQASTGRPALFHSGKPSSRRRALMPWRLNRSTA
jgi:hypothetical protein